MSGIKRRDFITLLGGAAAWPNSVAAQPRARRALVAMLVAGTSALIRQGADHAH